jgi:hypothetical protein
MDEYSSILKAAKSLGVCAKTIHNYANTDKILKNIYLIRKTNEKFNNSLPILVINTLTQKISKFSSIKEVANKFKVSDSTIRYYLLNNKKYLNIYSLKNR